MDSRETPDETLTRKELTAYLRVNPRTAYRLLAEGKLPALRVGYAWRLRRTEVDGWTRVRGNPDAGAADHG
ncbi:MAG TPA: helix-turn-helix domain-containing protein [Candidatus Krumholzibacteria bacterium]